LAVIVCPLATDRPPASTLPNPIVFDEREAPHVSP